MSGAWKNALDFVCFDHFDGKPGLSVSSAGGRQNPSKGRAACRLFRSLARAAHETQIRERESWQRS
ncbi:hypothetical protein [Paenibacillus validus]|uniref:hypothetical protein n=1 Tax=Paenibacillus validus TaxID=44253 RepID=UPI001E6046B3|nr:hypothetical protein [Paenibacillus validus]